MQPEDLNDWYVRNAQGGMVPFSAFATAKWTYGPQKLVAIQRRAGVPDPGRSPRRAAARARRWTPWKSIVAKLPAGVGLEWTGLSYEEKMSGLAGAAAVRVVADRRVPVPRGAVRELVDPGRRCCWWCRSACSARCSRPGCAAHERRLFPGRPADDDRPRGEERHAHRRVREGELRPRPEPGRRGGARRAHASAARS